MNKKFSTLLAGAALLGAVTANAGGPVKTVAADGLYQLAVDVTGATTGTDKVLTMDKDGKLTEADLVDNKGNVVCKAGEVLDDATITGDIHWYYRNVEVA